MFACELTNAFACEQTNAFACELTNAFACELTNVFACEQTLCLCMSKKCVRVSKQRGGNVSLITTEGIIAACANWDRRQGCRVRAWWTCVCDPFLLP